jgi:hypothetical protein
MLFEQAPPVSVPLRFLLTAPWFAVLAAALLAWAGPDALASRWSPALLGVTHLLTLGFMATAMLGALLQILPVVGGVAVTPAGLIVAIVHPALALGALSLAAGFACELRWAFRVALVLLASGFLVFLISAGRSLLQGSLRDVTLRTIALALIGLTATISFGSLLASAFGWNLALPLIRITALHAGWGLVGWTVVLVAGVAQQVVPMFQATPAYPRWLARGFAPGLFALLCVWSAATWVDFQPLAAALDWPIAAATAAFAITTLWLQGRSRRLRRDPTVLLWRLGMLSLLAASLLWAGAQPSPWSDHPALPLALGVLVIVGFALSVISAMLYRIVPFLLWLKLQRHIAALPPHVKQIMPDRNGQLQVWLHTGATLALLAAAVGRNDLVYAGAGLLGASGLTLGLSLLRAWRFARHAFRDAEPLPASHGARRRGWRELRP